MLTANSFWKNNIAQCIRFAKEQGHPLSRWHIVQLLTGSRVEIPFVEYAVTTRCTLKCRKCSNLIPYMDRRADLPLDTVNKEINRLLKCTDYIYRFKVHGGEPFLYPALAELLEELTAQEKIGEIRISTNGTVVPGQRVMDAMKNPKILVFVSGYPERLAPARDELLKTLENNKIRFRNLKEQKWSDTGDFSLRNNSEEFLRQKIETCYMANSKALSGSRFYICSRSANGSKLGLFEENVFVDLKQNRNRVRRELRNIYRRYDFNGCRYCDAVNDENIIEPAEQIG